MAETWVLFEWLSLALIPWLASTLSFSGFVSITCYQWFVIWWITLKLPEIWSNEFYNKSYLRNRGGFIKVRSIVRVQVFFLQLRAEGAANVATNGANGATFANGATKGAMGFQEAAPIPAEVENSDEEEQDWDWDQDPVDPFVRFFIWGNFFQNSQVILIMTNFALRLANTCLLD